MRDSEVFVVFRVAGGPYIGFGHLRRCWTLASLLREQAVDVQFVAASPEAGAILTGAGFAVNIEAHPDSLDQTFRALRKAPPPMVCVVDDPYVPTAGLLAVRQYAPALCIDDTCERFFPVDLVVNGSVGAETLPYHGEPDTRYLLGPSYILLRRSFARDPNRSAPPKAIHRVLVLMGGGETETLTQEIVMVITGLLPDVFVDVVSGPFGTLPAFDGPRYRHVTVHRAPDDLRSFMLDADLAVSGGGQTAYELAATATPTLGIRLARNQAINLRGLAEAGALKDLGSPDDSGFDRRLADALLNLVHDRGARQMMGTSGRRLVDGRGAERVVTYLKALALGVPLPKGAGSCRA